MISNVDIICKKHKNPRYQCNNRTKVNQSQCIKYGANVKLIMKLQVKIGYIKQNQNGNANKYEYNCNGSIFIAQLCSKFLHLCKKGKNHNHKYLFRVKLNT